MDSPTSGNSYFPRLYTDNTNTVFMSWIEETENQHSLKYSSYVDESWTEPTTITSDSTWFINWADFPSIIAQNGDPMAAHWLNKVEGGAYAYHVNMTTYDDQWNETFTPHKDGTPTEHGFSSMTPATDSTYLALWLDGRNTHNRANDEYNDINKAMTLRGAFIDLNNEIVQGFMLDDAVCDCCNTAIAKTNNGYVAAYRNRTDQEIRDIYTTTYSEGQWSSSKPVHADNWEIAACPVNGPAIDAIGDRVALAWFTGANGVSKVQLAVSNDGGNSFNEPIVVDEEGPLGRVDLNMTTDKIWLSWLNPEENGEGNLKINSYDHEGKQLASYTVPGISVNRSAGFPQITTNGEKILVAYTIPGESGGEIEMAVLEPGTN
ncbi:hypothetical protein [Gracilimonas sp.]|uniref:hypothetical protein n=1 Tax=Gracilimonas sp. TaxID=1974203 RepID=UPI00287215F5|nr:hypothetical protein [Gracilimonas sp.]